MKRYIKIVALLIMFIMIGKCYSQVPLKVNPPTSYDKKEYMAGYNVGHERGFYHGYSLGYADGMRTAPSANCDIYYTKGYDKGVSDERSRNLDALNKGTIIVTTLDNGNALDLNTMIYMLNQKTKEEARLRKLLLVNGINPN